jgi:hypothetical protein
MKYLLLLALILPACDATSMVNKAYARTAEEVIRPVVDDGLTGAEGDTAARCVAEAATVDELQMLARDVGVMAGTSTTQTIAAILSRDAAQSCLQANGLSIPGI